MIYLPKGVDSGKLLEVVKNISWEVSIIFKSYTEKLKTPSEFKKKLNIKNLCSGPVTDADIEVSNFIKKRIYDTYPAVNWRFLSEEDIKNDKSNSLDSNWIWIIDPLDGTKDFISGTGEYAMHLALTFKGIPILGLVLIPSKDELWIYLEGIGTWCESLKSNKQKYKEPNCKNINEIKILTSKSHFHAQLEFLLKGLRPLEVIGMGSVGYKVKSILRGEADLYISYSLPGGSSPKDWDMAAPEALIRGAGGYFTDLNFKNLEFLKDDNYQQGGIVIASMNKNHKNLCSKILEILEQ